MRRLLLACALPSLGLLLALPAPAAVQGSDPSDHRASPPGGAVRNEPSVAVDPADPQHLASAANDYDSSSVGVYLSKDGGLTWKRSAPPSLPGTKYGSDPHLVWAGGWLFAAYLSYTSASEGVGGLVVARYDERRDRWSTGVPRRNTDTGTTCTFADFPALAADTRGKTPVLYTVWQELQHFTGDCSSAVNAHPVLVSRSTDLGRTWSPPVAVQADEIRNPYVPTLTVGPRGEVLVTYDRGVDDRAGSTCSAGLNGAIEVRLARSTDGGRTFTDRPVQDTCSLTPPFTGLVYEPLLTGAGLASTSGATYRLPSDSQTVADPRGRWLVSVVGAADDQSAEQLVRVVRSTDGGRTWRPVGAPPRALGENQQFPRVAVGFDGRLSLLWIAQTPGGFLQASHSWSFDGGTTWSPVERVASVASHVVDPTWSGFIGDYLGNAVGPDGRAHPVWTDLREVENLDGGTTYTRALAPPVG